MITLNNLQSLNFKSRKRVARGNSGKATGRGLKGQKARSGVSLQNFQGGQTPLERRVPKHGAFKSLKRDRICAVPLSRIDYFIEQYKDTGVLAKNDKGLYIINKEFLDNLNVADSKKKIKFIGNTDFALAVSDIPCFSDGAKSSILKQGTIEFLGDC